MAVVIREFRPGDAPALHRVFYSAVHDLTVRDYSPAQINAWAPQAPDPALWADRMRAIAPFVAEHAGTPVGYADLQTSGYIDHFFVAGAFARRGIGTLLMQRILATAAARGTRVLTSEVSVTAQAFFRRFGFAIVEQRQVIIRGVAMPNASMAKLL